MAEVSFDYLDCRDGGLVRTLTTSRPGQICLAGDIVGMPKGIQRVTDGTKPSAWSRAGGISALLLFVASLALTAFTYRWVTGEWSNVWLLLLPICALLIPLLITVVVSEVWPSGRPTLPAEIRPPFMGLRLHGHPPSTPRDEALRLERAAFMEAARGEAEDSR